MKTVDTHQLYPQLPPIICIVSPKYWTPYSQLKIFGTFYSLDIFQVGYLFTGISCLKLEKKKKNYMSKNLRPCARGREERQQQIICQRTSLHIIPDTDKITVQAWKTGKKYTNQSLMSFLFARFPSSKLNFYFSHSFTRKGQTSK